MLDILQRTSSFLLFLTFHLLSFYSTFWDISSAFSYPLLSLHLPYHIILIFKNSALVSEFLFLFPFNSVLLISQILTILIM